MIEGEGLLLKFSGPWRTQAGVDEYFFPMNESISLAELLEKLTGLFGGCSISRNDGLVCLFDNRNNPGALKPEDNISPGSTLLFLGTVESG